MQVESGRVSTTVVIPTFNAEQTIQRAVASALKQTFRVSKVVVVDDGSADGTQGILTGFSSDSRVQTVRLDPPQGSPAAARNAGLEEVTTTHVAFLDADDYWFNFKLQAQFALLARVRGAIGAVSPLIPYPATFKVLDVLKYLPPPAHQALDYERLLERNSVMCSSVLVSTKDVLDLGGFDVDPQLRGFEDYDLWLRLSQRGVFAVTPVFGGLYRVSSTGVTGTTDIESARHRLSQKCGVELGTRSVRQKASIAVTGGARIATYSARTLRLAVTHGLSSLRNREERVD